jgi:hypothetical protein
VNYSPAFKWFILLLLPLTLGWKLALNVGDSADATEKNAALKVAEFLARQRFTVSVIENKAGGPPTTLATSGNCRVLVGEASPDGSDRESIRGQAKAGEIVFVVFHGRVYPEQPAWLTTFDRLWWKLRYDVGLKPQRNPVFFVIASKSCGAEGLPWNQLD